MSNTHHLFNCESGDSTRTSRTRRNPMVTMGWIGSSRDVVL